MGKGVACSVCQTVQGSSGDTYIQLFYQGFAGKLTMVIVFKRYTAFYN